MTQLLWGVDSAQIVTEELLECVTQNFGYPRFWGRYLFRVPNISEGLTKEEICFIHSKGIKLLPIYNASREAVGYAEGKAVATKAVCKAESLCIPKGTILIADIEPFFLVDGPWILGWTEVVRKCGYKSGIYNAPLIGNFNQAFCDAVKANRRIRTRTALWSAQPETEPSGPQNAPYYQPASPSCGGNVCAWQYSRDVPQCPVDLNLACPQFVKLLW